MCIVINHATCLNGSCTIKNTDDLKTLLGQNGPCTAFFSLNERMARGGVKMGEEQANKALSWFFFSEVNKEKTGDCGIGHISNPAKKPER